MITAETSIDEIIRRKGAAAGQFINRVLCGGANACYAGTSLQLGYAAESVQKGPLVETILATLNKTPNLKDQQPPLQHALDFSSVQTLAGQ